MARYVLIHGAWHGGWCWDRVAARLAAAGHEVLAPTLTGLSERAAELGAKTGLATFVDDITAAIVARDWQDIILVGHSFGGAVARGVHASLEERIGRLILLDALNPGSGESPFDMLPEATVRQRREMATTNSEGVALIPVPPLGALGIEQPADRHWVADRLTGHPLQSFEDRLVKAVRPQCPATYIVCTAPRLATLAASIDRAREEGFALVELAANHEVMITAPDALFGLLHLEEAPRKIGIA